MARSTDRSSVGTPTPPETDADPYDLARSLGDLGLTELTGFAPADEPSPLADLGVVGRLERLEAQADTGDATIAGRLEKLTAGLETAHTSSLEVVGLLAGQVVARVDDIAAGVDAAVKARHEALLADLEATLSRHHEELAAKMATAQAATIDLVHRLLAERADSPPPAGSSELGPISEG